MFGFVITDIRVDLRPLPRERQKRCSAAIIARLQAMPRFAALKVPDGFAALKVPDGFAALTVPDDFAALRAFDAPPLAPGSSLRVQLPGCLPPTRPTLC